MFVNNHVQGADLTFFHPPCSTLRGRPQKSLWSSRGGDSPTPLQKAAKEQECAKAHQC